MRFVFFLCKRIAKHTKSIRNSKICSWWGLLARKPFFSALTLSPEPHGSARRFRAQVQPIYYLRVMEFLNRIELKGVVGRAEVNSFNNSQVCNFSVVTEYSTIDKDWELLHDNYVTDNKKSKLGVKLSNERVFIGLLKKVCCRVVTGAPNYEVLSTYLKNKE